MGEAKRKFTKEMQALVAAALNNASSPPNFEGTLIQHQQWQLAAATHASPLGASPLMSNAQGLNWPDNSQSEMPKTTVPKPYNSEFPYLELRPVIIEHKTKLTDDAKERIQECVSDFVRLMTREACENCRGGTITAADIMAAVANMGFTQFFEPVEMFLPRYRDSEILPFTNETIVGYDCAPADNDLLPYAMLYPQYDMMFDAGGNVDGYYLKEPGTKAAGKRSNAQAFGPDLGNGQGVSVSIRGSRSGDYRGSGPSGSSAGKRNNVQVFGGGAHAAPGNNSGMSVTIRDRPSGGGNAGGGPSSSTAGTRNNEQAYGVGADLYGSSTYGMYFYDHYLEYM